MGEAKRYTVEEISCLFKEFNKEMCKKGYREMKPEFIGWLKEREDKAELHPLAVKVGPWAWKRYNSRDETNCFGCLNKDSFTKALSDELKAHGVVVWPEVTEDMVETCMLHLPNHTISEFFHWFRSECAAGRWG